MLDALCPRCLVRLPESGNCADHGSVPTLWRPEVADYLGFADMLARTGEVPLLVPWPLSPRWSMADFGCVVESDGLRADGQGRALATVSSTVGESGPDGEVEVDVVTEEPGVGLGARLAGIEAIDVAAEVGSRPPAVHVRLGQRAVALWSAPPTPGADILASATFVGEADGRWLWVVMRPASSALLLRDDWILTDASAFGPEAVEIPFGGGRVRW